MKCSYIKNTMVKLQNLNNFCIARKIINNQIVRVTYFTAVSLIQHDIIFWSGSNAIKKK